MRSARDLLALLLLIGVCDQCRPRAVPSVGRPRPPPSCPVAVEAAGVGVGCLDDEDARRAALRAGDRLRLDGGRLVRGRMAPARLAAWRMPVDLNRASLDELASLDGVGPKLAERIAAARPFATVDEVARVRGLGGARLSRLRERLTVTDDAVGIGVDP
jgi:competence ComEA-like helix-hairpin-helix protein